MNPAPPLPRPLLYATTNPGKVISLQDHLRPYGFDVYQRPIAIPEPRLDRIEDIARLKAIYAYHEFGRPIVANDAGFYMYNVNGFPRTFVNFALATIQLEGLLRLVTSERRCAFRHALAFHDGQDDVPAIFVDTVRGRVAPEPRGMTQSWHWSELTRIFIPDGQDLTLAEMDYETFRRWRQSSTEPSYALQFVHWYHQHRSPVLQPTQ